MMRPTPIGPLALACSVLVGALVPWAAPARAQDAPGTTPEAPPGEAEPRPGGAEVPYFDALPADVVPADPQASEPVVPQQLTAQAPSAGSLWLDAGGAPPEGRLNPRQVVADGDTTWIGVGSGVLASGYVVSVLYALISVAGEALWVPSSGYRYGPHPCRETATGLAFVPVLGPWLALATLDQCGVGDGYTYRNSLGQAAWTSVSSSIDLGVSEPTIAIFVISGLAQVTGLAMLVAGLLGHHTEIRFEDRASLSIAPHATRDGAGIALAGRF